MTYNLAVPEADRDLVVACLRAASDQRMRVARTAAGTIPTDKAEGKEVRGQALKVAMVLAESNTLATLADTLAAATMAAAPTIDPTPTATAAVAGQPVPDVPLEVAIAVVLAAAGQTPAANLEDPLTGATLEDLAVGDVAEVTL